LRFILLSFTNEGELRSGGQTQILKHGPAIFLSGSCTPLRARLFRPKLKSSPSIFYSRMEACESCKRTSGLGSGLGQSLISDMILNHL
jgi:hypothetical protein